MHYQVNIAAIYPFSNASQVEAFVRIALLCMDANHFAYAI